MKKQYLAMGFLLRFSGLILGAFICSNSALFASQLPAQTYPRYSLQMLAVQQENFRGRVVAGIAPWFAMDKWYSGMQILVGAGGIPAGNAEASQDRSYEFITGIQARMPLMVGGLALRCGGQNVAVRKQKVSDGQTEALCNLSIGENRGLSLDLGYGVRIPQWWRVTDRGDEAQKENKSWLVFPTLSVGYQF